MAHDQWMLSLLPDSLVLGMRLVSISGTQSTPEGYFKSQPQLQCLPCMLEPAPHHSNARGALSLPNEAVSNPGLPSPLTPSCSSALELSFILW